MRAAKQTSDQHHHSVVPAQCRDMQYTVSAAEVLESIDLLVSLWGTTGEAWGVYNVCAVCGRSGWRDLKLSDSHGLVLHHHR